MTYADLVLFQCLDGLKFAFPKTLKKMEEGGEYGKVFGLYQRVKEVKSVKAYLESDRRKGYSSGIYRHYPELEED
jgi:glutathione S-transferase